MTERELDSSFTFEGRYGPFLRPIVKGLFNSINIPLLYKESILSLAEQGHIVFIHGSNSSIDALLLNYKLKKDNLPNPGLIFERSFPLLQPASKAIKYFADKLLGASPFKKGFYKNFMDGPNNASILFLNDDKSHKKLNPILELLRIQRDTDKPILLVPQRIIYQRAPLKLKDNENEQKAHVTDFNKLLTLIRGKEHGFVEHGEPINLLDELKKAISESKFFEDIAAEIHTELQERLALLGSNISGAPIRERSFLIDKTMRDPMLQSFLRSLSLETGKSVADLEKSVRANLSQIAADLSPRMIKFLEKLFTWVFNNIFDGLDGDENGIQAVREMARKGALVYIPCHKSHIDYIILSYYLFHNWMSVPVVAAGINLAFFPAGMILRRAGAFFMKRTFKDNPLYAQTFGAYVRTLLGERIPMEFFIEGGRSRSGKLMMPKKGLLSMIIQGWESGASRDVIFVPVYVGYDTVVEENSYISEMTGATKEKENFFQLLKASSILKNRYGKVYLRFAKPISLNKYMADKATYSKINSEQKETVHDILAGEIIQDIFSQTVVTPISLISCVLLSTASSIEEETLKKGFHQFLKYLKHLECNLSAALSNEEEAFKEAILAMKTKDLISIDEAISESESNLFTVEGEDRIHLEYYKNSILNFFVPASLVATVLLKNPQGIAEKAFQEQVGNLADLLGNEFILSSKSVEKAVKFMTRTGTVRITKGSYTASTSAEEVLKMYAGLIENYLESYLCVAKNLDKIKGVNKKDILKTINRKATRMFKEKKIRRFESLCMPVYKGALDTLKTKGLIDDQNKIIDEKPIKELIHEIEGYLEV